MSPKKIKQLVVVTLLVFFAMLSGGSAAVFGSGSASVASAPALQVKPIVVYPEAFAVSVPASEVPADLIKNGERKPVTGLGFLGAAANGITMAAPDDAGEEIFEFPMLPLPKGEITQSGPIRPLGLSERQGGLFSTSAAASAEPALSLSAPLTSFDGLSFQDNVNAGFGLLSPPDTNGDVGPNHYVQMTNLLVRVWDKAGNPLTAPFKLSSLFTPLGGQCAAPDAGDPIVLYDPLADRWLLSQFAFASISSPPYHECIAISQTGDPTGAYYLYDFVTPAMNSPIIPNSGYGRTVIT